MLWIVLVTMILFVANSAEGYEIGTHKEMVSAAVGQSAADQILKQDLGLEAGILTKIRAKPLEDWLTDGAENEDDFPRFLNHFHNPLASSWSQAGLGISVGQSAILWAQNPGQSAPSWSWQDVRQSYLDALTKPSISDRDKGLAATFEGLGRQMHLVQDAASPAHARNDPHIFFNYESAIDGLRLRDIGAFERWVGGVPDTPDAPDLGWRALDGDPLAPIAVARLVDTDRYTGSNPDVTTGALIGLAEYTNANFLSEDRIFTENDANPQTHFPFPRRSGTVEQDFDVQVGGATVKRRYLVKVADGATGYRLATVGFLREYHRRFGLDLTRFRESGSLDEVVYRDYAERLVPRAVTYSTALVDYFFRGGLDMFGSDAAMAIRNDGDEAMNGEFTLYYDDAGDTRRTVPGASWTQSLGPGAVAADLRITAPTSPAPKEPGRYMLVFRGMLGSEPNAVVGKQVAVDSALLPRLLERKDGAPIQGASIQAIDRVTGQVLSAGTTDQDGRTELTWRPGRTVLFIPAVNVFPMYWAGSVTFASAAERARVVQSADLDAQGRLTITIPIVDAQWPERTEECSGLPQFAHSPQGFVRQSTLLPDSTVDLLTVAYNVNLITFVRDDDGAETILCGADSGQCKTPAAGFVAEDVNRIGEVVGHLVRDLSSGHLRQITDSDGVPLGPPVCFNNYAETNVVAVTVAEP